MAYLDNNTITVDAVLTRKGRELLSSDGALNITSFALADDEIDYRLYQPNHPKGSAYYDVAIRNIPILEAFTDETQVVKYKLVTLPAGVTSIPTISLGMTSIVVETTFKNQTVINPSTNPTSNTTLGYTAILGNKNVGTLVGSGLSNVGTSTVPAFLGDLTSNSAQVVTGLTFTFVPNTALLQSTSTRLTIVGNETGGSVSIPVTVMVTSTSS
jgi:hypothetical protein